MIRQLGLEVSDGLESDLVDPDMVEKPMVEKPMVEKPASIAANVFSNLASKRRPASTTSLQSEISNGNTAILMLG